MFIAERLQSQSQTAALKRSEPKKEGKQQKHCK
jgi:hypothetical protein